MRYLFVLALVLTFLSISPAPSVHAESAVSKPPSPFLSDPAFSHPILSPDGNNLGFIATHEGHKCLFNLDLKTGKASGLYNPGKGDVITFWWLGNDRVLVAGAGRDGITYLVQGLKAEPTHVVKRLSNYPYNSWFRFLPGDQDHVIYTENGYGRVVKFNLETGKKTTIEEFEGNVGHAILSAKGEVRATTAYRDNHWFFASRPDSSTPWTKQKLKVKVSPFWPIAMAADDKNIIVLAYDQGDTNALMSLDPSTGARTLLAQRPDADIRRFIWAPGYAKLLGVSFFDRGNGDTVYLDSTTDKLHKTISRSLPETNNTIISSSDDGRVHVIEAADSSQPPIYYLLNSQQGTLSPVGHAYPDLKTKPMGKTVTFEFTTRDGLKETGFIVLPSSRSTQGTVPLIIFPLTSVGNDALSPHYYHPQIQYLASRGFAVASFAVRGSSGFGKAFQKAGDFQLGEKVVQDIEDGVAYLVKTHEVDPGRIGILGHDIGGLLALHTAASSSTIRAVVALNALSELRPDTIYELNHTPENSDQWYLDSAEYQTARQMAGGFDSDSFISSLSAPALLVYSSSYGRISDYHADDARKLIANLRRHKKDYELAELDFRSEKRTVADYTTELNEKIVDFLERKMPASKAAGDKPGLSN